VSGFLDRQRIEEALRGDPFVSRLELRDSVGSTNDVALQLARDGAPPGTVVVADRQTAGRGRLASGWHSPAGVGLYLSVLLRPRAEVGELTRWTLGAAVAACESCRQLSGGEVVIRWPNDLLWRGRKLAGVIAELRSVGSRAREMIIGAGFNVGQREGDWPVGLIDRAASLRMASEEERPPDRELLLALFLRELSGVVEQLEQGRWAALAQRWERLAPAATGAAVRVVPRAGGEDGYDGVTAGLDTVGALRVRTAGGAVRTVRQAESVRSKEE
jgi:BirA family biotin operon repressor/biotin-[acetyl-CoA-carboxylase] ligase